MSLLFKLSSDNKFVQIPGLECIVFQQQKNWAHCIINYEQFFRYEYVLAIYFKI